MSDILSIQNLSVSFRSGNNLNAAISGINIEVGKGELVAVVGESGSGKSVTCMSILQLLPKESTIYASGKIMADVENYSGNLLNISGNQLQMIRGNRIAMVFQEPMSSLNPVMQCGKQVAEAILRHKKISAAEAKHQTIELFEKVKLPNPPIIYDRYPHQLSGGQKQRVMIAMAMSCNPDLLICDEPTTALDATVQQSILLLLKQLQKEQQLGIIFITHDLGVVAEIADRVAVMYKGNIVETGTMFEIFNHPKHPYTKALLACRPTEKSKGKRLPVVADFITGEKMAERPQTTDDGRQTTDVGQQDASNKQKATNFTNLPSAIHHPPSVKILSVQNLNVWYPTTKNLLGKTTGYFKAVNGVSFDVFAGETLGLVGESGCGKTTLGRCLLQLLPATSGHIFYKDKDLAKANKKDLINLRKEMQVIFQDPFGSLNPRITVGEAIAEPLKVHGLISTEKKRKEKTIEWLEKVGLKAEHFNRYPHEFSGGQRQRIVIARALILNPSFVVCDEAVSALDVSVQAQVLNLLNDLKKEMGFTNIFISHNLAVVHYVSDRIMVMQKGQIEEIGNANDVYFNPKSDYTKKLIAAIPGGRKMG